jgi:hypothetical protein
MGDGLLGPAFGGLSSSDVLGWSELRLVQSSSPGIAGRLWADLPDQPARAVAKAQRSKAGIERA